MNNSFYQRLNLRLNQANRILITTHESPDADGLGSELALVLALENLGKEVTAQSRLAFYYLNSELG
jgi:nanoRNase/pAp phosphatase (c-di-AMP/oligoRNAs hydrolase)